MATAAEWRQAVHALRGRPDKIGDPAFGPVYKLACGDAVGIGRSFLSTLSAEEIRDLAADLIVARIEQLTHADSPRAFFATALINRLKDVVDGPAVKRRAKQLPADSSQAHDDPTERLVSGASINEPEDARAFLLDARRAFSQLSDRDRDIVTLVGLGEDREAIAAQYGTTRANVDQIVSRLRRSSGGDE